MESCPRDKPRPIRIFLIIDNRLTREALARLFQKQANLCVVGLVAADGAVPIEMLLGGADVLLLDDLGPLLVINSTVEKLWDRVTAKMILFGMKEDPECFVKAVCNGISGYLLKEASSAELVGAVRSVVRGEAICPGKLCMVLFQRIAEDFRKRSGMADEEAGLKIGLTFRQRQLLSLVAKGMSNKEIASNLNLSECTVKNHVYRIMKHVEAQSRQEAVDLIRSRGYLVADVH